MGQRPFRFGLQSYAPESGDAWREQARKAEDLGFSALHTSDHVIGPGPALAATNHPVVVVAPIPAMAVAAEATSTIKVGCRVFCTDFRNPVIFAKELATLDLFAPGRIEIGLGAGWLEGEYEAIGLPFDRAGVRIDRMEETIAVLRACLGEGEANVTGEHVHAVGFEGVPSMSAPPVFMIGGGAPRVLGIAGREADIVSLNFDNRSGKIGPAGVGSSTAELTAQKMEWIKAGAGDRFDDLEIEIGAYFTVVVPDEAAAQATREKMAPMFSLEPDQLMEHPHALIGTVDWICDELVARRERYGISYVTFGASVLDSVAPVVDRLAGT